MRRILALDLSLSGLGMVAGPAPWDFDWKRLRSHTLTYKLKKDASPRAHVDRLKALASDVGGYIVHLGGVDEVWAEDLPTRAAFNIVPLAELRAAVRIELATRHDLDVRFAQLFTLRKLLLGKLPRKGHKEAVLSAIKALGDPFKDDDQRDAFAVYNFALSEAGHTCWTRLGTREVA